MNKPSDTTIAIASLGDEDLVALAMKITELEASYTKSTPGATFTTNDWLETYAINKQQLMGRIALAKNECQKYIKESTEKEFGTDEEFGYDNSSRFK